MAKRRSRGRGRRFNPERGWLVGSNISTLTIPTAVLPNDPPGYSQICPIFQFNEIDGDEGVLVSHDKSDWFMQRMIIDVWFTLNSMADPAGTLPPRLFEFAIVTADNAELVDYITEPAQTGVGGPPISDVNYDRYARILHTDTGHANLRRMHYTPRTAGSIQRVDTAGATANWGDYSSPYEMGAEKFKIDISPKVALRPDQSCALVFGGRITSAEWSGMGSLQVGDILATQVLYRVLLQKRRS